MWKTEDLFFRSPQKPEKTVAFFVEDLVFFCFFLKITSKLVQNCGIFFRLFWSSQNRKCVIFELALGPSSVGGAHAQNYPNELSTIILCDLMT